MNNDLPTPTGITVGSAQAAPGDPAYRDPAYDPAPGDPAYRDPAYDPAPGDPAPGLGDDPVGLGPDATTHSRAEVQRSQLMRVLMLIAVAAALVAAVMAFLEAQDPASGGGGGPGYDVVITAPADPPGFQQSTIWTMDTAAAEFYQTTEGVPAARIRSHDNAAIVGLKDAQERVIALAVAPPGLEGLPAKWQISPNSTALSVVALHPDVLTPDPDTYLARLATAAASPAFDNLASMVDGVRPIANWGSDERDALRAVVAEVVAGAKAQAPCSDPESFGGSLVRCPGEDKLLNLGRQTEVVFDGAGQLCGTVPGATERVDAAAIASLGLMITDGVAWSTVDPTATVEPGSASLSSACGQDLRVVVDTVTNPDWELQASRTAVWVDDTAPLSWYLGATTERAASVEVSEGLDSDLAAVGAITGPSPHAGARFRASTRLMQAPQITQKLGLGAPTGTAVVSLDELASVLEGVYS